MSDVTQIASTLRALRRVSAAQAGARVRRMVGGHVLERSPAVLRAIPPWNGGPFGPPARWGLFPSAALAFAEQQPPEVANATLRVAGHSLDTHTWTIWDDPDLTALARYCVHYFEWLPSVQSTGGDPLAAIDGWRRAHPVGVRPAWDPYPTSLRAWVLCGLDADLDLHSSVPNFAEWLDAHYRTLRALLETDIGGNHLIANLKALIGLAVWRADNPGLQWAMTRLGRTLRRQILADGGHEERSPAYHARVLADLLDVQELLTEHGPTSPAFLDRAIAELQSWLESVVAPDGSLPSFNDGGSPATEAVRAILNGSGQSSDADLRASGYVVRHPAKNVTVVMDIGAPGPLDQPGHAHSGIGSFALFADGQWLVRNTGSSTYEHGATRDFERSSTAQNVATFEDQSQLEQWSSFRTGRTPSVHGYVPSPGGAEFAVTHDGYTHGGKRVTSHRAAHCSANELELSDAFGVTGRVSSRLHVSAEPLVSADGHSVRVGMLEISFTSTSTGPLLVRIEPTRLAAGLGYTIPGWVLRADADLEVGDRLRTSVRWGAP